MQKMKSLVLTIFLLTAACTHLMPTPPFKPSEITPEKANAAYTRVLEKYVNERGQIDFQSLMDQRSDLDRFVAFVAANAPTAITTKPGRLAYEINAHNALAMFNVLEAGIPKSVSPNKFFKLTLFTVGGVKMSLAGLEQQIFDEGDERALFALNGMTVSSPRLARKPFQTVSLEADLDAAAKFFFGEIRNLTWDAQTRTIMVSELLQFHSEVFLKHNATLRDAIDKWRPIPQPKDFKVRFLPFDWTLNNSAVR